MADTSKMWLHLFILMILLIEVSSAKQSKMGHDSECYLPNGADYEGKQNKTYVKGSGTYEPTIPNIEVCLPWKDYGHPDLPENYCRNPNNRLFPWCNVMKNGAPGWSYCHIPTCNTPALIGCFKLYVNDDAPSKGQNVTTTGPPLKLILDGENKIKDPKMRIGRCLRFCRTLIFDYAGVTGGDSCMCGMEEDDGHKLRELINHLHPHECLQYPCVNDKMQSCGGENAIAIYDVEAGSCGGVFDKRDFGIIYSPRWPGNYYNSKANCRWTIYVPDKYLKDEETRKQHQMHVYFSYFNLVNENDTLRIYTYANSTDTNSVRVTSYLGINDPVPIVLEVSEVYAVHIVFDSDPTLDKTDGFILHYNITNLEGQMETTLPDVVITESTPTTASPTTTTITTKVPAQHRTTSNPTTTKITTTTKPPPKATAFGTTTTTVAGATKSTTRSTNSSAVQGKQSSEADGGMIAGIVIGVLVFLVLVVLVALYLIKWRSKETKDEATSNLPAMFNNPVTFNSDTTL